MLRMMIFNRVVIEIHNHGHIPSVLCPLVPTRFKIPSGSGREANRMDQRMSASAEWTVTMATISRGRNDEA